MPHCDPAPPHPEPGAVYNVVCPPSVEVVLLLVALVALIAITNRYIGRDESHGPGGDEEC